MRMPSNRLVLSGLMLCLLLTFSSCNFNSGNGEVIEIRGETMGSYYIVKYIPESDSIPKEEVADQIQSVLVWVNSIFNHYDPESVISNFNKKRDLKWVDVGEKFIFVLDMNQMMSEKSEGAFDPTVLPLTRAWGFAGDYRGKPEKRELKDAEIKEIMKSVGLDKIEIDRKGNRIRKKVPGVELEFSASVPGLAADDISWAMTNVVKTKNFMIDVGGEMHIKGTNHGKPWKIAIEAPVENNDQRLAQKVLELSDTHVATSGNYRNYIESSGEKLGHVLDARTGKPAPSDILSVTVLDDHGAFNADLWSTTLMSLGVRRAYFLAEQSQLAAFFVYKVTGLDGKESIKTRETSRMSLYGKSSILNKIEDVMK